MREQHLHLLALLTRLAVSRCICNVAIDITGIVVDTARNLAVWRVRTTFRFQTALNSPGFAHRPDYHKLVNGPATVLTQQLIHRFGCYFGCYVTPALVVPIPSGKRKDLHTAG